MYLAPDHNNSFIIRENGPYSEASMMADIAEGYERHGSSYLPFVRLYVDALQRCKELDVNYAEFKRSSEHENMRNRAMVEAVAQAHGVSF